MSAPHSYPGKLLVFEGIDGTGKSSQIEALASFLREKGQKVITSFEPTKGPIGQKLRASMLEGRLSAEEEIELFLEDRRDHVRSLIEPHLEKNSWVLLDRYYFSMMAYQGARGHDPQIIRQQNEAFAPRPDLVFWLDLPVPTALSRIGKRGQANEFEKQESLEACREIFASIQEPWFLSIEAQPSPEAVHQNIVKRLQAHFPELT